MQTATEFHRLRTAQLGDIIRLPDGRDLSIRACEPQLRQPVGSMHGWLLAGEIGPEATLLSMPATPTDPVLVFMPLDEVPRSARSARTVVEGAVSYWAPHLPNVSGAMGELLYRVCHVPISSEPMVLIWRGQELVVFVQSAVTSADALQTLELRRAPHETEQDVTRYAGRVSPHRVAPVPAAAPVAEPARRWFSLPR